MVFALLAACAHEHSTETRAEQPQSSQAERAQTNAAADEAPLREQGLAAQADGPEAGQQLGTNSSQDAGISSSDQERKLTHTARAVVAALASGDYATVAAHVHPERGVRFSSYAFVRPNRDQVLSAQAVRNAPTDERVYLWGYRDGTGKPIRLPVTEYVERFVYDADYQSASELSVDRRLGRGNSIDNAAQVYPDARVVEFHVPGTKAYAGMDWRSLRLVFVRDDTRWWLVGIVHDEWTI